MNINHCFILMLNSSKIEASPLDDILGWFKVDNQKKHPVR